ncbi:hypothetical protein PENTCL1PPCAC_16592 [Pristionchus entomophagus]|uniref:G protein-coupled receptor n=1 Tax=Pristionchus entomophagus TaxID=358040 RepID=A0AAV5TJQ5_9BILA|nr:hypothetical protein PENTCL1PPCAC_16592 [Pristionchus entomophagus]
MTAIFVVRRKLIAQTAQSKATDKRHHEFIARALTYQIMLPCAAAIGVFFWILNLSQIWSSEFSERLIMGMFSVFSLASPFINFTLLPPYRALLPFSRTQTLKDVAVAPLDFTTTIDKVHLAVLWTLDILAIAANLLLITAILIRTPTQLRAFSVFLLNNALVDLATAVVSALAATRIIENHVEGFSIFIFLGPCSQMSNHLCRLCQAQHVNLVVHSTIILLLSFAFRLYILHDIFPTRPPPSPTRVWLMCLLPLILIATLT